MSDETKVSRDFLVGCVADMLSAHPDWRYGQTVFNVANTLLPDCTERLRGSPLDPFYSDAMADAFLDALFAIHEGAATE